MADIFSRLGLDLPQPTRSSRRRPGSRT